MKKKWAIAAMILVACMLGAVLVLPVGAADPGSKESHGYIVAKKILSTGTSTATGGFIGDLTGDVVGNVTGDVDAGDIDATGDLTVGGAVAVTGGIGTGAFFVIDSRAVITVTSGGTITPTGSFQPVTSAASLGTSDIVTTTVDGTMLYLLNVGTYTITLTDTGVLNLSGNLVMTADDTAVLVSYGSEWYQLGEQAN